MNKKALLGFVLVLILVLTLAGLTFYKVAEIFGLHQTQKALNSFYQFVDKVNDTSVRPVGTKQSMPLYMDEKSAIFGFSRNSNQIIAASTSDYVKEFALVAGASAIGLGFIVERDAFVHFSPRPRECGGGACLCLCRDYDWRLKWRTGVDIQPIKCREAFICYNFTNFDFPPEMGKEDFGMDFYTEGGFMIARNYMIGNKEIESRLTGVYITKESGDLVSVSYNVEGVSKDTLKGYQDAKEAESIFFEAHNAYAKQDWNSAITKYEELINNKLADRLIEG